MIESVGKAKIKWQCRRGMLELDLLLDGFVKKSLDNLTSEQLRALEALLLNPDPVVYDWLLGKDKPTNKELLSIVELIKAYNKIT